MQKNAPGAGRLWDEAAYPYHPRRRPVPAAGGGEQSKAPQEEPRWTFPWRAALRWIRRLALIAAAIVALGLVLGVLLGRRIISDALVVNRLESNHCELVFVHQLPGETDPLPLVARNAVGDRVFSEVAELSYFANGYRWNNNNDAEDVEAIIASASRLRRLRSLALVTDSFAVEQMKALPQLGQLEQLEIGSFTISDEDMPVIAQMSKLQSLAIRAPNLSLAAVGQLHSLTDLDTLELYGVKAHGSQPPPAKGFRKLRKLVIEETSVDDQAIIGLGPLPGLEEVELSDARLSDEGLAHLLASPNLRSMIVNDAAETDVENAALVRCPGPEIFHLAGLELTDRTLGALEGRSMQSLVLDGSQITDAGLKAVGSLAGLRYLSLRNTRITGTGAAHLKRLRYLSRLDLRSAAVTRDGIAAIAGLPIPELVLADTALDDEGLMVLSASDTLMHLDITATQVTADGLRAFFEARKRRLSASRQSEYLFVETDHPQVVEEYIDVEAYQPGIGGMALPSAGF